MQHIHNKSSFAIARTFVSTKNHKRQYRKALRSSASASSARSSIPIFLRQSVPFFKRDGTVHGVGVFRAPIANGSSAQRRQFASRKESPIRSPPSPPLPRPPRSWAPRTPHPPSRR